MATSELQALWNHPAGPKTTVTATGVIWSRRTGISVNIVMAGTGIYQLGRKIRHDYFNQEQAAVAAKE